VVQNDVKQIQNDDSYFIFEDVLSKVMYYWTRDYWLIPKIYQNNNAKDCGNTEGWFEPFIDNKRKFIKFFYNNKFLFLKKKTV